MRRIASVLVWSAVFLLASADTVPIRAQAGGDAARVRPNYELASRWTASKVTNR